MQLLTNAIGIFVLDFPGQSRRSYPQTYQTYAGPSAIVDKVHPVRSLNPAEDEVLDPVSALLKADEIVSRTKRSHPPP